MHLIEPGLMERKIKMPIIGRQLLGKFISYINHDGSIAMQKHNHWEAGKERKDMRLSYAKNALGLSHGDVEKLQQKHSLSN